MRFTLRFILTLTIAAIASAESLGATSPLDTGRWVKIEVAETGMQQITAAQLAEMGFDDLSRVAVRGYSGVELASHSLQNIDATSIPAIPAIETGDKLIFYAESGFRKSYAWKSSRLVVAVDQNQTSACGYYFLTEEDSPARLAPAATTQKGTVVSTAYSGAAFNFTAHNPFKAGTHLLSDDITRLGGPLKVTLRAPLAAPSFNIAITASYVVTKGTQKMTWPDGTVISTNNTAANGYIKEQAGKTLPESPDGNYEVTIDASADYAAVDYLAMTYRRRLLFDAAESQFEALYHETLAVGRPFEIGNADGPVEMWDVTDIASPLRLNVVAGDSTAIAVNAASHSSTASTPPSRYIIFRPDMELHSVRAAGEVTPSDLDCTTAPDMLIIAAPAFRADVQRLADLHARHQQMRVAIATPGEIYDRFSSGTPSVDALRRYIRLLHDLDPERLRHVLLVGKCTYDPRSFVSAAVDPAISMPTYATETLSEQVNNTKSYASDSFFGKIAGNDFNIFNRMDVNVGRLSVLDTDQLNAYIDKAEQYLSSVPSADTRSHAILMADNGNKTGHVDQAEAMGRKITALAPNTMILKAYDALYDTPNRTDTRLLRSAIASALADGVGFMDYCGHANPLGVGSNRMWNVADVAANPIGNYPFVSLSTCDTYTIDRSDDNIGNQLLFDSNRGAIALSASCRTVQMNYNHELNMAIAGEYYRPTVKDATLGDVFRTAHNDIMGRSISTLKTNTLCYNFGGDPALPLYDYTHSIALDAARPSLQQLSASNRIEGSVTLADGTVDESFDGTVKVTLYAPDEIRRMLNHDSSDTLRDIRCNGDRVAIAAAQISSGRFSVDIPVPQLPFAEGYRLHLSALSSTDHRIAALLLDSIAIAPPPSEPEITGAPTIAEFYAVDNTFINGDLILDDVTLHARILPSGYGISQIPALGRTPRVTIDGRSASVASAMAFSADGAATVEYRLDNLADGLHTATLSVSDYAGNTDEQTITFSTIHTAARASLTVDAETASDRVTVDIDHTYASSDPQGRLSIIDKDGLTVYTAVNPSYPFVWDLRDAGGNVVPDGHYTARAWLHADGCHVAALPAEIIIVK